MAASAKRDFVAMEERRREGARLLRNGVSQAEVARLTEVSRQSVSRWASALEEAGLRGLRRAGRAGRKPRLDERQLEQLVRLLKAGPEVAGFPTGLWTLPRVAQLIEKRFGVAYATTRVWQLLRQLGFTPQRSTGRARERDEARIEAWKRKRWPQVKKTPPEKDD
ncbi:MAG TPA: IS630 family transposase [Gammaproteobacteria bacterium]|jgi:transposase